MKIYLLNPPFKKGFCRSVRGSGEVSRGGTLYYPICLSYATGVLEQQHDVRLVDAQARKWDLELVLEDIKQYAPDMVIIDTNFACLNNDLAIASQIKHETGCILVIVGPPASQFSSEILSHPDIDIAVRYEYDITLQELAKCIESGLSYSHIAGISYLEGGKPVHNPLRSLTQGADLDQIPFVSKVYHNHLNIEDYFLSSSLYPVVQIFTGRGCPNQCTFCSWPSNLMGRKYRVRSLTNVLDELEWIQNNLDVKEVFFEDDTFTINKSRVLEFCEQYKHRNLDLAWSCNTRVNTLDLETMKAMKRANCRLLIAGYESGSETILKTIKKGTNVEQMRKFAKNAKRARLMVHGDFIIGLPGETRETIQMTKDLIYDLKPELLQVLVPQPIPGTELYAQCKREGFLLVDDPTQYLDDNGHQKAVISYPALSNEEMVCEANEILREYYLSPGYVPLAMGQVLRKNSVVELKRLWISAKMFLGYAIRG
ncbi:radical SAM protein [Methanoculleus sp. YWC-01]|uniref:Radical SAM protein n=1 Tax=Methanoculleus nereidis TaxID=2735141 RepID=A0ABU3Z396_9EURY|nr:radical SAM protein [Methanoculleus sp. YWC-01]MDV4343034.1 radical SAM protein [Methanoculleus sp. YWC-01]